MAVIGANGFIGMRLVESLLLGSKMEVRPVVREPASFAPLSRFALRGVVADALDCNALASAFNDCDVVVHAAAGNKRLVIGSIEPVYEAARTAGVKRLVYLSSLSVHGYNPDAGTDESLALQRSHEIDYCNWKVRAEQTLRRLQRDGAVEVVVLRPGIVFGPRSSWIREFAVALLEGRAYITDNGDGVCPSIYVDNLVHAVVRAALASDVAGEAFIVGDREHVSWRDLYQPIVDFLGFNWTDDVHRVPGAARPGWLPRTHDRLANSPGVAAAWSQVPRGVRKLVRDTVNGLRYAGADTPAASVPVVTASREATLLQEAQNKLSHAKAERMLGYAPPVTFAEGMHATLAWLAGAGYQPLDSANWLQNGKETW
jgi:nucleoside-diphosphate-sugar epimerase